MLGNHKKISQTAVLTMYMKPLFIMSFIIGIDGYPVSPLHTGLKRTKPVHCYVEQLNQKPTTHVNKAQPEIAEETSGVLTSSVDEKRKETELNASKPAKGMGKTGNPFQHIIMDAASRHQVDPEMIKAIIMAESSFNPKAVSRSGARGLMQLMPHTAKYLGVIDSFDPNHNIEGGVRYFKKLLIRFDHNVELALAAYNAGTRNVIRYGGIPPFKETKFYIKKVLKYYENYKSNTEMHQEGSFYLT